jgi:Polyketide cyclase / dehydrase and lipid transport
MILQVARQVSAEPARVWQVLIDWAGQSRWIPFTTVDVVSDHDQGLGVRAVALSGFRLGRIPVGLLDNFVVTGWSPAKELEVLHLGPYFTGEGAFRLEPHHGGTRVTATEVFSLPGGKPIEAIVRLGLPLMRAGFRRSLRGLATIAEGRP